MHAVAAQLALEPQQQCLPANQLVGGALERSTPSSAGSRGKSQRLVVTQDLLLQGPYPPAGREAEVLVQASRQIAVHLEGLDLRTRAVEGKDETGRDLFVVRSLGSHVHQLLDHEQVTSEREVGVDPGEARCRVEPTEPLALDLESRKGGDTLEEVATIEAQRRTQQSCRLGGTLGHGFASPPASCSKRSTSTSDGSPE